MFLNSIWKGKGTRITKVFLKKKKEVVKFTVISGLQVIKTVLISARTHRPVDSTESRGRPTHDHLAPDKGARAIPVKHAPSVRAEHAHPRCSGMWTAYC